jgi:hypothetical protein
MEFNNYKENNNFIEKPRNGSKKVRECLMNLKIVLWMKVRPLRRTSLRWTIDSLSKTCEIIKMMFPKSLL